MPVVIGAKPSPGFSSPIELLSDCHRRIEGFLAVLVKVCGQVQGGSMSDPQRRDWRNALEYFRIAAPRHTADEEESLFPRLRQMDSTGVESALTAMDALEADHERASAWHEQVDQLGTRWLDHGTLPREETRLLAETLARLRQLYDRHIAVEDNHV